MIRSALGSGLSLLLLFAAALAWLSAQVVQPQPLVAQTARFFSADAERAKRLIRYSFLQQAGSDQPGLLQLTQPELQLLTDYLLSRRPPAAGSIKLQANSLTLQASIPVPSPGGNRHLNLSLQLRQSSAGLRLAELRIGDLDLPEWQLDLLWKELLPRLLNDRLQLALAAIEEFNIEPERISIAYQPLPTEPGLEAPDTPPTLLDQEALRVYQQRLVDFTRHPETTHQLQLVNLLLQLSGPTPAAQDSTDLIADNRSLLLVVGAYVNGHSIRPLFGDRQSHAAKPTPKQVLLLGRHDLAQHFAGSAALAAVGSRTLADAAGLFKEMEDSRQGSGFSFRDLAADLAGARFGQLATESEAAARYLRRQLDSGLRARDLMPDIHDLPERLSESELERDFGGVEGTGYLEIRRMIEQRIEDCTLYRRF